MKPMAYCTIRNKTNGPLSLKLSDRQQAVFAPGQSQKMELTGDKVGYLRALGFEVVNPEEAKKPPKGSKRARLLELDPDYDGPKPWAERGTTVPSGGQVEPEEDGGSLVEEDAR